MGDADLEADEGKQFRKSDDLRHSETGMPEGFEIGRIALPWGAGDHVGMSGKSGELRILRRVSHGQRGQRGVIGLGILGEKGIAPCGAPNR